MAAETWIDIRGFEGQYQISSLGRVRSVERSVPNRWGPNGKTIPEKILVLNRAHRQGYIAVHLYTGSRCSRRYVHRLVAEHFVPNPSARPQVNHRDGDKTNNAADNLEWVTARQNCQHAIDASLYEMARGERAGSAKLTEENVIEIRRMVAAGATHKDAAARFGIGRKAVTKIINRQRWAHVNDDRARA